MDFVLDLPITQSGKNSTWLIIDQLTKSVHFLPFSNIDAVEKLTRLYVTSPELSLGDNRLEQKCNTLGLKPWPIIVKARGCYGQGQGVKLGVAWNIVTRTIVTLGMGKGAKVCE